MAQQPLVVDVDFTGDTYDSNIKKLCAVLADHPDPEDVDGHPVLAKQLFPEEPARWIHINISTGDHKATILAIRDDNVYLIGFKAENGTWFEFGKEGESARMIPESTFLECGPDYRSLLGDNYKVELVRLQLGKTVAEEAVVKLSGYVQPPPPDSPDEETKLGLARLILMICESSRMTSIFDTVSKGWTSGTCISNEQVPYLHNWKYMSEALLGWKKYGNGYKPTAQVKRGLKMAKITNKAEALAVVQLLLNRPPPPQVVADNIEEEEDESRSAWHLHAAANLDGHGQQLVEVFAVRAGFPFTGTIAVFDGIRGQIIYKPEHEQLQPTVEGEMVLTGPHRAISADGSFAIKADINNASTNNAGGKLTWNCYDHAANTVYDAPLKGAIGTDHGPVEVTYAVLTNAVEATVQVRLLLAQPPAAGFLIHGKVTARSKAFDVASVLFSPGSEHKVVVAANESMIPLNRSVISVPLDAPLVVEASLFYTPADAHHGREGTVQAKFEFYPELYGNHVKREFTEQGEIEVKVTWSDI